MSAAEKIAKLEALLERIGKNRVDAPVRGIAAFAARVAAPDDAGDDARDEARTERPPAPIEPGIEPRIESRAESTVERTLEYDRPDAVEAPTPQPAVPASALVTPPRPRLPEPTPMERAISGELVLADDDDDEPELEISYPDSDEPALLLEVDEPSDAAPTAPIHTRSPEPVREPMPEPVLVPMPEPMLELIPEPVPQPVLEPEPTAPERLALAVAQPSAPIARVVARPRPRTFGELLDRALALRPR